MGTKAEKKVILLKQVGQNINLVFEGQKLSRRMTDKEEREALKALVDGYNTKNSKAKEKEILNIINKGKEDTKKDKENKAVIASKSKETKAKVQKVKEKPATAKQVQEAKEEKAKEPVPQTRSRGRRGEY